MVLEDLLFPLKWTDEQILRQYTKIALWWEEQGKNVNKLALYCNITSAGSMFNLFPLYSLAQSYPEFEFNIFSPEIFIGLFLGNIHANDLFYTIRLLKDYKQKNGSSALDLRNFKDQQIQSAVRFPLISLGCYLVYSTMNEIFNQGPMIATATYATATIWSLGLASSMYLKDTDPKELKREKSLIENVTPRLVFNRE